MGLVALFAAACATPSARRAQPLAGLSRAHAEPELVSDPPDAEAKPKTVKHRVEPGQTLYRIARTFGVPVEALMAANGITDPRTLAVGQELVIPAGPGQGHDRDAKEATRSGASARERSGPLPQRRGAVELSSAEGVLDWPLRGVLYARFGKNGREHHDGIDLAAPLGTPVKTAKAGTVLYAGEQKGYGLIVIIDHGQDVITLYAHNRDLRVRTGQKVRTGQVVSTVGESGRTSGPHLHFEVRKGGLPVDPLGLLGAPPEREQTSAALGRRSRGSR